MDRFRFFGDSKDVKKGFLRYMYREAQEITYRNMRNHVPDLGSWAIKMGYAQNIRQGLTLARDPRVKFFRSTYRGFPCYFLLLEGVSYIWTRPGGP
jgi:hypothetical protein